MRNEKGFTLIETLVGLAVLGVIGITLLCAIFVTVRSNTVNNNLNKAENLARAQLEYIQSQPFDSSGDYAVLSIPANCGDFSYTSPMATTISSGLQKITVTATNNHTAFTLSDYKVDR